MLRCMECRETLKGEKQEVIKHARKCHSIKTTDDEGNWWNGSVEIMCDHCDKIMTISVTQTSCKRKTDNN